MWGDVAPMRNSAVAIVGLPAASSQLNSQAFQMSTPKKGKADPIPSGVRASAARNRAQQAGIVPFGIGAGAAEREVVQVGLPRRMGGVDIPAFWPGPLVLLTLLANAHVFAPADLGVRHLLIGADRIVAVGDDEAELESAAARRVDLQGRRLIPGLLDGHAHVTGGGGESGFASRVPPVALSQFTRAGVTGVVGVLGTDDTTRDTRSLVAQTYALRELGLGAWCHTGGYHVPPVTLTGCIRDDIVFVEPIIGVGEVAIADHRSSQPTDDELKRIAADTHVAGMMSGKAGILHLHLGDGPRGLDAVRRILHETELPTRVFNPTHVNRRKALI